MKRFLPGRSDIAVFASLSILCAAIVANIEAHDAGLSLLAFPLFIVGGIIGLWRSGKLAVRTEEIRIDR